MVPATTGLVVPFTGHEEVDETLSENQAGLTPTPMVVDQQIFYQPVQAYFQFVQNNLTYMNESNIDLFRQEAEERHTQIMEQMVQRMHQQYESHARHMEQAFLNELAQQRAEAGLYHEHATSELSSYAVSRTVAEQEILNLRKELGEANAKLKNISNSTAMEAEQRSNQKVSHLTRQYEARFHELRTQLEADCKKVVDDTVSMAAEGIKEFKEEEQHAMSEMKAKHERQETLSAELNAALQDRVDELVEKVNKLSTPRLDIEELNDEQEAIPLEVFQTPKGNPHAKAGETSKPASNFSDVGDEARERLRKLFATTPAGSAAPPVAPPVEPPKQIPPVLPLSKEQQNAEPDNSVPSPTVLASEPDKNKPIDSVAGLTGQQLVDLITRLTSKEGDGEKPRTKEAESIKLNDMPAPEAYRHWRNHVRDEVKSCSDKPDEAWAWLNEVFDTKTERSKLEDRLQDPGKFITLDTKLSAALTRAAKGDLATKIHNFKDEKSKNGIQVRG